jgi:hypothetical protein
VTTRSLSSKVGRAGFGEDCEKRCAGTFGKVLAAVSRRNGGDTVRLVVG